MTRWIVESATAVDAAATMDRIDTGWKKPHTVRFDPASVVQFVLTAEKPGDGRVNTCVALTLGSHKSSALLMTAAIDPAEAVGDSAPLVTVHTKVAFVVSVTFSKNIGAQETPIVELPSPRFLPAATKKEYAYCSGTIGLMVARIANA